MNNKHEFAPEYLKLTPQEKREWFEANDLLITQLKSTIAEKDAEIERLRGFLKGTERWDRHKMQGAQSELQGTEWEEYLSDTVGYIDFLHAEIERFKGLEIGYKDALQNQMQCVGELKEYLHNAKSELTAAVKESKGEKG